MKINLKNSQSNNLKGMQAPGLRKNRSMHTSFKEYIDKKQKYNTPGPAQAVSFSGSIASIGKKFVNSNFINKGVNFVTENEAAYNAVYSLLIAGILKPTFVLSMPGSEEKDKQIVATKNFLQAFIGSFLGLTIGGGIVKKAIDVLSNDLELIKPTVTEVIDKDGKTTIKSIQLSVLDATSEKAKEVAKKSIIKEYQGLKNKFPAAKEAFNNSSGIKKLTSFVSTLFKELDYKPSKEEIKTKAQELVANLKEKRLPIFEKNSGFVKELLDSAEDKEAMSTLMDAFKSFWKNSAGSITAIGKAKISSFLLPGVMAFLFAKKNLEKARQSDVALKNNAGFKNEQQKFQNMLNKNNNSSSPTFTGKFTDKIINNLAVGVERGAMSKLGEKLAKALNSLPGPLNKPSARMADIESTALTAYWVFNTNHSKKIDPSQKLGLNVHTVSVTAVSSVIAFIIDTVLDGPIRKASNIYGDLIKENIKNIPQTITEGNNKEAIKKAIKQECNKLFASDKIANTLSEINLKNVAKVDDAIKDLSKDYCKKLSKFKSLTVFTFVVRFLVPVLMVPISGKLKKKVVELKAKKEETKNNKVTNSVATT